MRIHKDASIRNDGVPTPKQQFVLDAASKLALPGEYISAGHVADAMGDPGPSGRNRAAQIIHALKKRNLWPYANKPPKPNLSPQIDISPSRDPEIVAMESIVEMVDGLSGPARRRVMAWLSDRWAATTEG
jgi:hypothetical protein